MEIEMSTGVTTLIARMKSNPEEFFGDAKRWQFMFREHFRDVMTEAEKGAIHGAMKEVRRLEFDALVVKEILRDEREQAEQEKAYAQAFKQVSTQGSAGVNLHVPKATYFEGTLAEHAAHHGLLKAKIEAQIRRDDILDAQRLTMLGKQEEWISK